MYKYSKSLFYFKIHFFFEIGPKNRDLFSKQSDFF